MKVEFEIKNLDLLISALSISMNMINDERVGQMIGCESHSPTIYKIYKKIKDEGNLEEILTKRLEVLEDLFNQSINIERSDDLSD